MNNLSKHQKDIFINGYTRIENIFTDAEINNLAFEIDKADTSNTTYRKTDDLFAIRQFLKEIPAAYKIVFNDSLKAVIRQLFGSDYFVVKSIYFDKPERSNWFVSWHQDLTISVDKREEIKNYGPWTTKQNQFAVQPPLEVLEDNFTIRIHLDDTNENNGALKVIPGSHLKGVYRPKTINWENEFQNICCVNTGGIMVMKPLLLHSSNRTTDNRRRRVVHIEFSKVELPSEINWSEKLDIN
jgi:ectoine hydroxylase-related dioxygenase (phytanoyl-CoA dioxygenase family)